MDKVNIYSNEQLANVKSEFLRINDTCYLDHAGATLYSEKQLKHIFEDLTNSVYANPHGRSTSSSSTIEAIDIVRYKILNYFNDSSEDYSVIFTSGTTHGLKIIAESFDYNGGTLVHLEDNHTSVLGMRMLAPNSREIKVNETFNTLSAKCTIENSERVEKNGLFVFPAQSNFSGTKYPLTWIEAVRKGRLANLPIKHQNWFTLLDAASFVSTNHLDLNTYKPDFVTISFYKIFGYPTGLGALLVKRSSERLLAKHYLGGGTVLMALSSENIMISKPTFHERFEDGTIDFLSILSLTHGFDTLKRLHLTPDLISKHTFNLAKYTFENMLQMHHSNGEPIAVLYHDSGFENIEEQGGIVNFNLKRANGDFVGYAEVLNIANLYGVQLRTGCFCNPGACQRFLKLSPSEVKKHFAAGHVCGDQIDLVEGYPTGSIRISFGYMSTFEDADRFLTMIEKCFITQPIIKKKRLFRKFEMRNSHLDKTNSHGHSSSEETKYPKSKSIRSDITEFYHRQILKNTVGLKGTLINTYIYPVKSCGAYEVDGSWKLTDIGLKYDRKWMIVNASGSCVSQKKIKNLCMLKPLLDLSTNTLRLRIHDTEMAVPLEPSEKTLCDSYFCDSKVCGDKVIGYDCGDKMAEWLSDHLERPGLRLLRQCDFTENHSGRTSKQGEQTLLSLANKAEYLLINMASVRWLRDRIPPEEALCHTPESIALRFRANFVVDFPKPFVENKLEIALFDDVAFKIAGPCTRCQMICIDQDTGEISTEPLQTLSKELDGKMRFGVYLSRCIPTSVDASINTGCTVNIYFENNVK